MTRTERFFAKMRSGEALVADGATGTMHQLLGLAAGTAPEVWVLEQPEQIRALHRAYIEAGADVILTCSFGGTNYRLESHGLADRVVEVNRRAAELAREVAKNGVFVAGDMGPTGQLLAPLGTTTPEQIADAFAAQATGLAAGGADFLLIETMSDLGEAQAAIEGARRVTDLPIICTFSFDTHGRTMMGVNPELVATKIGPLVEGVGANCGKDPAEYASFMDAMAHALRETKLDAILWAKPNAGLPRLVDDEVEYDATPEYMGQMALQLRGAGAQVVGGCCGTTSEHVAAIAAALNGQSKTEET